MTDGPSRLRLDRRALLKMTGLVGATGLAGLGRGEGVTVAESGTVPDLRAQSEKQPWSMYREDKRNTGYNPTTVASTVGSLSSERVADLRRGLSQEVTIADKKLFVSESRTPPLDEEERPRVVAVGIETGEHEWSVTLGDGDESVRMSNAPTYEEGIVYVGVTYEPEETDSVDYRIYMLDADTGGEINTLEGRNLREESEDTARVRPQLTPGPEVFSCNVTVVNDRLYFDHGTHGVDGTIRGVDIADENQMWTADIGQKRTPAVTFHDGTIYTVGGFWWPEADQYLSALDPETGEVEWVSDLEGELYPHPVAFGDTIYVGGSSAEQPSKIYALDSRAGDRRGAAEVAGAGGTIYDLIVVDGRVYALSRLSEGETVQLSAAFPEQNRYETIYEWDADPFSRGAAIRGDQNHLYVKDEKNVRVIDPDGRTEVWKEEFSRALSTSPTVVENAVYVGDEQGGVHTLRADSEGPLVNAEIELRGISDSSFEPGETVEFEVHVRNTGTTDYIFAGTAAVETPDGATLSTEPLYVEVEAGTAFEFTIDGTLPDDAPEGEYDAGVFVFDPDDPESPLDEDTQEDAFVVVTGGVIEFTTHDGTAPPGGQATLTFTVENTGTEEVRAAFEFSDGDTEVKGNATLAEDGFTVLDTDADGGAWSGLHNGFPFAEKDLSAGETWQPSITIGTNRYEIGTGEYRFPIPYIQGPDAGWTYDEDVATIGLVVELTEAISLTSSGGSAPRGGEATLEFGVTNNTGSTAEDIAVWPSGGVWGDGLPGEWEVAATDGDDGEWWRFTEDSPEWSIGTLGSGETRNPSISFTISSGVDPGSYTFESTVGTAQKATVYDRAEGTIEVLDETVDLELVADGDETTPGGEATVEFTLRNTGEATTGAGVQLRGDEVAFAPDWTVAATDPADGEWFVDDRYWATDTLAPTEEQSPTITFEAPDDAPPGEYTVEAEARRNGTVVDTATATIAVERDRLAELEAKKLDGFTTPIDTHSVALDERPAVEPLLGDVITAVEDGDIPADDGEEALVRLIRGEAATLRTLQLTGPASTPEDVPELDVTRETVRVLFDIAVSLLLDALAIKQRLAQRLEIVDPENVDNLDEEDVERLVELIAEIEFKETARAFAELVFPDGAVEDVMTEAEAIAEDVLDDIDEGVLETSEEIKEAIDAAYEGTLTEFAEYLRVPLEAGIDTPTRWGDVRGLDDDLDDLHDAFTVEGIQAGIDGDREGARQGVDRAREDLEAHAEDVQEMITELDEAADYATLLGNIPTVLEWIDDLDEAAGRADGRTVEPQVAVSTIIVAVASVEKVLGAVGKVIQAAGALIGIYGLWQMRRTHGDAIDAAIAGDPDPGHLGVGEATGTTAVEPPEGR